MIKLYDLSIPGFDLFQDSETFLHDLTEDELNYVQGGCLDSMFFELGQLVIFGEENSVIANINLNGKNINGQTINAFTQNNVNTYL